MQENHSLLLEYAKTGSETAFRDLVSRYVDLVYSTAVRLLNGDTHRAEDVAQTVFLDLARKAGSLSSEIMLGGWLHRHTCFVAANLLRGERRRQQRERQAVQMNSLEDHSAANLAQVAPILDDAINQLGPDDRAAILLRFFEKRDFRSVGEALGGSENAAQKRVARALEELRGLLQKRGVALSAAALGTAMTAEAVTAAPASLAAGITTAATAVAATTSTSLIKLMAMTKLKAGIVGAIVIAGIATPLALQHQAQARLRDENSVLREQNAQLSQLTAENERLSNLVAGTKYASSPSDPSQELLRLRAEVTRLQSALRDSQSKSSDNAANDPVPTTPAEKVALLKQKIDRMPERKIPELQLVKDSNWTEIAIKADLNTEAGVRQALSQLRNMGKGEFAAMLGVALRNYAANNGQPPVDIYQLKPYFAAPVDEAMLRRYQIIPGANPGEPAVTENSYADDLYDTHYSISPATADGHTRMAISQVSKDWDAFSAALEEYYWSNNRQLAKEPDQLMPYIQYNGPIDQSRLQKFLSMQHSFGNNPPARYSGRQ